MRTSTIVWILVAIIIILGLGWYFVSMSTNSTATQLTSTPNQQTPESQAAQTGQVAQTASSSSASSNSTSGSNSGATSAPVLMKASNSALGTFLVASNGMTLYIYTPDTTNKSNCTGQCASLWPPYTVSGTLAAASGITGTLATITRSDGSKQLTYNGHPLYFYQKDSKPGDTIGQGVGGVWFVEKP